MLMHNSQYKNKALTVSGNVELISTRSTEPTMLSVNIFDIPGDVHLRTGYVRAALMQGYARSQVEFASLGCKNLKTNTWY
jgi:hypothetical protein